MGSIANYPSSLAVAVFIVAFGFFTMIIFLVCVYRFLQMSEDVRYLRHKTDPDVKKPMDTPKVIAICVVISAILALIIVYAMVSSGTSTLGSSRGWMQI